jgi:TPR repeat protein
MPLSILRLPLLQPNLFRIKSMLRFLIALILIIGASVDALGQVRVRGYTKKDGTYVAPHMRSSPNSTQLDNWSVKGNVNPYTGVEGTRNPTNISPQQFYRPQINQFSPAPRTTSLAVPTQHYSMAYKYFYGRGVRKDYSAAFNYSTLAANEGSADAMVMLGYIHGKGLGVPRSDVIAAQWMSKAAADGNAIGQYNLGLAYYKGSGLPKSSEKAAYWFLKSAEQGNASAKVMIGQMYYSGTGVTRDFNRAVHWLSGPASEGHGYAQYRLGVMHLNGEGVFQDVGIAARWLTLAAERRVTEAQFMLGLMYRDGIGLQQSDLHAYKWLKISVRERKPDTNGNLVLPQQEAFVSLSKRMTPAEIDRAEALVSSFFLQ